MPSPWRTLAAAGIALAMLPSMASDARAAAPGTGSVSIAALTPSHRLAFAVRPGAAVRATVRVRNSGASPRTVDLWPTGIATGATGGMEFPDRPARAIGDWLRLSRQRVRVPAHGHRDVRLEARVPRGDRSGERFAGVVAVPRRPAALAAAQAGLQLRTIVRLALPVQLSLPGTRRRGLAADGAGFVLDAVGTSVALRLRATGNARIRSTDLDVRLMHDGKTALRHRGTLADVFPRTGLTYRIPWRARQPAPGAYRLVGVARPRGAAPLRIDVPLRFGSNERRQLQERTDTAPLEPATSIPAWVLALGAGALVLVVGFGITILRLRRRLRAEE